MNSTPISNAAQGSGATRGRYVLATAAYNEAGYIEKLILSIVSQTVHPLRWVIVSDGSTDATDEIVRKYAEQYEFIQLYRITEPHPRNFSAQANAINTGFVQMKDLDYDFIGNLDADITLEPSYFGSLLDELSRDSMLGLSGGQLFEDYGQGFVSRAGNQTFCVAHGVQMFRRACLEALGGGYAALPYGGSDWHAEVTTRMRGWHVRSFAAIKAFHHRPTGAADGYLRYCYRQGFMDFSFGCHPLFEIVKLTKRALAGHPRASIVRLSGFVAAHSKGGQVSVSPQFVEFLRAEQWERLRGRLPESDSLAASPRTS